MIFLEQKINNLLKYSLIVISALSFWSGVIYKLYSLNYLGVVISLILAIITSIIIIYFNKNNNKESKFKNFTASLFEKEKRYFKDILVIWPTFYCLFALHAFYILFNFRTDMAIISPWQVVPLSFFFLYTAATLILFIIAFNNLHKTFKILISIHFLLSFSVIFIIYKIGYGHDPFIHNAAMDAISEKGVINPKPFYYLGYYGLIVIIHKLFFIPIEILNKLLVPLSSAVFIPFFIHLFTKKHFENGRKENLTILVLLSLPFVFLTVSVPQSFSYLFLLIIILYSTNISSIFDCLFLSLLALATFLIHPVAGIPAILFTGIILTRNTKKIKYKSLIYFSFYFLSAITLPLAFFIFNKHEAGKAELKEKIITLIREIGSWFYLKNPNQENFILNFIYLYGFNIKFIIILLALCGTYIAVKYKNKCQDFFLHLNMSVALFFSYVLTRLLPFDFLISYERENYADRILLMAAFFLFPFLFIALFAFFESLLKREKFIRYSFVIFFSVLITISLYLSYPRFDHYHNSRGFSVSRYDIEAAHWIEKNAGEADFVVLANQQVSAAALREFGFKKYYETEFGPLFYYPIPTGQKLYDYYLEMVYEKPSKETIKKALDLTGAELGYFVLNKYWWASPRLKEEAMLEADSWQEFGEKNEVIVFRYGKN